MSAWVDLNETLTGLRGVIVHAVAAAEEERVRAALADGGFDVRVIEGAGIVDEASFFEQVSQKLPMREYFGNNWDAFNDGMCDMSGRVAVLWRDADRTFASDAQTLLSAVQGLFDAGVEPARDHREEMLQLEVFLFGAGPGFQPLGG